MHRVELGLNHPGNTGHLDHILSGLSGFDLHYKYPGFCIGSCVSTMAFGIDQSNELNVLTSDGSVSPQRNGKNGLTVQLEYFNHSVLG